MGISPLQLIRHPERERLVEEARAWIKALDQLLTYRFTENNLYVKIDPNEVRVDESNLTELPVMTPFLSEVIRHHYQKFGWRVDIGKDICFYPEQLYDLV